MADVDGYVCPVCGDRFEFREDLTAEGTDEPPTATIDIDELCTVDRDTRWNRVCPEAVVDDATGRPVLRLYRHHWEDE